MIPFFRPDIGQPECDAATAVLRLGNLTRGPQVAAFEAEFAARQNVAHGVAVNSCTTALYLTLRALGIGEGDTVVTTPITWHATALAIEWTGAKIAFADVNPNTGLMDPENARLCVAQFKAKAVIPVHLHGWSVNVDAFLSLGVPVIWDCAHAIETEWHGRPAGSFPVAACYSFFASKNLTAAGEGGMVVTDDDGIDAYVRRARFCGVDDDRRCQQWGANLVLTETQAAVARVQLARLDQRQALRTNLDARYRECLGLRPREASAHHLFAVRVRNRDAVRQRLTDAGIGSGLHYPPLYWSPHWWIGEQLPGANAFGSTTLSLPFWPEMPLEYVEQVADLVRGDVIHAY